MTVLLATTTVVVMRSAGGDPDEVQTYVAIDTALAHIGDPSGSETLAGGAREAVDAVLLTEPGIVLANGDRIYDTGTDLTWDVTWVRLREGLGLDHIRAGLRAIGGAGRG